MGKFLSHGLSNVLYIAQLCCGVVGVFTGCFAGSSLYIRHSGSLDRRMSIQGIQTKDEFQADCDRYKEDKCPDSRVKGNAQQMPSDDKIAHDCDQIPKAEKEYLEKALPDLDFDPQKEYFQIQRRKCSYTYGSFGVYVTAAVLFTLSLLIFLLALIFENGQGNGIVAVFIFSVIGWVLLLSGSSMYIVLYGDTHKVQKYVYERELDQILDYEGKADERHVLQQERRVQNQIRQWNEKYNDQLPDFGAGPVVSWGASQATLLLLIGAALFFTNQDRFRKSKVVSISDEEN